jgi:DNA-binding NtrC family response regulator
MESPFVILIQRGRDFAVATALARSGYQVAQVRALGELAAAAERSHPDIAVIDDSPENSWLDATRLLRDLQPDIQLILVPLHSSETLAVEALRAGFDDYVRSSDASAILAAVERCSRTAPARSPGRRRRAPPIASAPVLIGQSAAIARIRDDVRKLSAVESNVLITGDTGTGKEVVAELIHSTSARRSRPLVSVNCAAVPDTLLESELFGYERGAFTGADVSTAGKLEQADGGTLFLDEIGDMTPAGQAKILRVADGKDWSRLGGTRHVRVDLRIIAATNQDLEAMMMSGRFRRDLYFRLNVARVELQPLRERRDDVPLLVAHYIGEFNLKFGCAVEGITDEATAHLVSYDWPGNIRELRNVVEGMFLGEPRRQFSVDDLPARIRQYSSMADNERERLIGALKATHWNKSRAAEQLHWSRMTLYRKMIKHGVTNGVA